MKLKKFQKITLRKITKFNGRALVADDMGLGKTISAGAWIERQPDILRCLVVCPAIAKWHWKKEMLEKFGAKSTILESYDADWDYRKRKFTIINFHILHHWTKVLVEGKFDLIIVDECHELSNPDTIRFKALKKIVRGIPYRLGLSGTPLTNRHSELWPILNLLRPDKYPSRFEYGLRFCSPRKERGKWIYKGSINGDVLHKELLSVCMIRQTKDQVLDLPPKTRYVIPLDIVNREEYNLAVSDFRKWLRKYNPYSFSMGQRRDARTQLGYLIRIASRGKIPNIVAWIHNFFVNTGQKLIVFGINRNVLQEVEKKFQRCSVLINGSVIGKKRQDRIDQFNTDPKCRLLLGNIIAAGSNWSSKQCWNVAHAQLAWKPGLHIQAEDRCRGLYRGGGNLVSSFWLVAHGTVEEDMCELLQKKAGIIDTVLDNGKVAQEFDIHDKLLKKLAREWK